MHTAKQELSDLGTIRQVLEKTRTIAVIGAHIDAEKPAHYVPAYLHEQGYQIFPVNPKWVGRNLWGQPVRASLSELEVAIDLVDIFRRSDQVGQHVDDILALSPLPRVAWLQLGIRNDEVARVLLDAGIDVVQDRCTLADHRHFNIGPISRQ